jgi:hypothetical protein
MGACIDCAEGAFCCWRGAARAVSARSCVWLCTACELMAQLEAQVRHYSRIFDACMFCALIDVAAQSDQKNITACSESTDR